MPNKEKTEELAQDENVVIDVSHLTKDYGYGRGVFDVSIKVHKGECYGYLGPNGAGKSTTIRHIMGFSKPTTGYTKIFGIDTFGNTDKILGRVGYLPGEPSIPQGLDGWGFLRMMQDMRNEKNDERLKYLLDLFKLDPGVNIKEMSLGEKRKLAVVAAFMNDPDVLILDEPTSGLDPVSRDEILDIFRQLVKKEDRAILFSTHITSDLDKCASDITYIHDGEILYSGTKKDFINSYLFVKDKTSNKELLNEYIAYKEFDDRIEGLINADKKDAFVKNKIEPQEPDLEQIMVYLERSKDGNESFDL